MYKRKSVAVVVPCYNEETQIARVVNTMPKFVDWIVVIDDVSKDKTAVIIKKLAKNNPKIVFIQHEQNQGVGGAIASGYKWSRDKKIDIAAVMAGDGQMLPKDLPSILDPVATGSADYAKANRLITEESSKKIPQLRFLGNAMFTFLTKVASGYWHIMDSQTGYTAINIKMLRLIDWDKMYKRFGQPNDLLVRLNIYNAVVRDVPLEPVYGIGERSKIKSYRILFAIPLLLLRMFLWRMKEKYIIRDFHPLVFFYFFGFAAGLIAIILFIRLIIVWPRIPQFNFLAWMLCVIASIQFISFAMWFDMEYNKELK